MITPARSGARSVKIRGDASRAPTPPPFPPRAINTAASANPVRSLAHARRAPAPVFRAPTRDPPSRPTAFRAPRARASALPRPPFGSSANPHPPLGREKKPAGMAGTARAPTRGRASRVELALLFAACALAPTAARAQALTKDELTICGEGARPAPRAPTPSSTTSWRTPRVRRGVPPEAEAEAHAHRSYRPRAHRRLPPPRLRPPSLLSPVLPQRATAPSRTGSSTATPSIAPSSSTPGTPATSCARASITRASSSPTAASGAGDRTI